MGVPALLEINDIQEEPGAPQESLFLQQNHMKCQEYRNQTYDYQLMGSSGQMII